LVGFSSEGRNIVMIKVASSLLTRFSVTQNTCFLLQDFKLKNNYFLFYWDVEAANCFDCKQAKEDDGKCSKCLELNFVLSVANHLVIAADLSEKALLSLHDWKS